MAMAKLNSKMNDAHSTSINHADLSQANENLCIYSKKALLGSLAVKTMYTVYNTLAILF